jgi:hypothetical protein
MQILDLAINIINSVITTIISFLLNIFDLSIRGEGKVGNLYLFLHEMDNLMGMLPISFLSSLIHTRIFFFFVIFFPLFVVFFYILMFLFTKFFSNYFLNVLHSKELFVIFGYLYFFLFILLLEDFLFFTELYKTNLLFMNNL